MGFECLNCIIVPTEHFLREKFVCLLVARVTHGDGFPQGGGQEVLLDPLVAMQGAWNQVVSGDVVPLSVAKSTLCPCCS